MPEPRKFSREQTATWIAEDKADMPRFAPAGSAPNRARALGWPWDGFVFALAGAAG